MMITPTPRAITPQDIVRIYVPAASPEEIEKMNGEKNIFEINNQFKETNGFIIKNNSNRNSHCSGENTPVRNSLIITDDDIYSDLGINGRMSTSSSRRGSMSRKSPAFVDNDLMVECTHMRSRKNSSSDTKEDISPNDPNRMKLTIGAKENDEGKKKIMTSFEELAKKSEERMSRSENYGSPGKFTSDEEDFTFYQPTKSIRLKEYSKYESDCNIQYKALSSSIGSDTEHRSYQRRQNSSGNESSPFESDGTKSRFFGAEEYENYVSRKNKSSDDSTPSPNSKSILTTPVNDTVPLLLSSPQNDEKFKFKIPITSSLSRSYIKESPVDDSYDSYNPSSTGSLHLELQNRSTGPESLDSYMIKNNIQIKKSPPSKIPLYQPIKSPTSECAGIIQINSTSFDIGDRRMAAPIGGPYEFNSMHKNRNQKSKTNIESNKIRIKINQSQKNQEN